MKISRRTAFVFFILFMLTLPLALISCSDLQWRSKIKETEQRCNMAVTAHTSPSELVYDGWFGWKRNLLFRPVFSYTYEGKSYRAEYFLTYETDPFPQNTEVRLYVNGSDPKMCYYPDNGRYYDGNRIGFWGLLVPLLPLGAFIWVTLRLIRQFRWQSAHPRLVDPDDMPYYMYLTDPKRTKIRTLRDPLFLTVRGKGAAFASNPQFCDIVTALYEAGEQLKVDERFRALHSRHKTLPLHVFYLNPEKSEWMVGVQLPQAFLRKRALNAFSTAAEYNGLTVFDADTSTIGSGEERFETEATDLVKYLPVNSGSHDIWMLHDVFEDDPRKCETEPVARSLMLHVKYKGKQL